jgi:hypothetical protein
MASYVGLGVSLGPSVTPIFYDSDVVSVSNSSHSKAAARPSPASRSAGLLAKLDEVLESLQDIVRAAEPGRSSGDEAQTIVARFVDIERTAGSGVALYTPVVVANGSYTKQGFGSPADWLGRLTGSSAGSAKGRLAAAECAAVNAVLTEALHDGDLSADQLKLVTKTTAEVKDAAATLLPLAQGGASHQELSDAAANLRAAARRRETERARRARVHARRHFRWHQAEDGGIRGGIPLRRGRVGTCRSHCRSGGQETMEGGGIQGRNIFGSTSG